MEQQRKGDETIKANRAGALERQSCCARPVLTLTTVPCTASSILRVDHSESIALRHASSLMRSVCGQKTTHLLLMPI